MENFTLDPKKQQFLKEGEKTATLEDNIKPLEIGGGRIAALEAMKKR